MEFTPEQMRAIGYRAIDMLVEHFESRSQKKVTQRASRGDLAKLREPLPQDPSDPLALLSSVEADIFAHIMHVDHPRFFAFVPSPSNFVSVIADLLATGHNVFAGTWLAASAPTEIELVTIEWLRGLCGLPASWSGLFTSGGSMANLTALATARQVADVDPARAVVYFSDQTHSSVYRALKVLGLVSDQCRELPADPDCRLGADTVRAAIAEDRRQGLIPLAIVANAGTTNTGAVDPLEELGLLAEQEQLWLHIDAAYGGAALLTEEGKRLLAGRQRAHSLTLDPHKWLFQPFDIGCLLLRDASWLESTFHILPAYLRDAATARDEVNLCDWGLELTRPFRAFKLWMTFKTFGAQAVSAAVQRGIELAGFAESEIRARPAWTIVTPAQLGIVTFRFEPQGWSDGAIEAANQALTAALIDDGFAMMSTTELGGRTVCRLCTINPQTTERDIAETVCKLNTLAHAQ